MKDLAKLLIAANLMCLGLLVLTGWFAYLQNGYWGWPFAAALISATGIKSAGDRLEDEEKEIQFRVKMYKKYGEEMFNKVCKN